MLVFFESFFVNVPKMVRFVFSSFAVHYSDLASFGSEFQRPPWYRRSDRCVFQWACCVVGR